MKGINMKKYKFTATRGFTQAYEITIEAKNEEEAYDKGKDSLKEAVGYDNSKDWTCSDIRWNWHTNITRRNNGKK